jgi:hypothetical protein
MSRSLPTKWLSIFGAALPVGFLCRVELADRWLRIHSLPDAKRYATNEAEYAEVLHRQNTVGTYALGEGAECDLYVTRYGDGTDSIRAEKFSPLASLVHVFTATDDDEQLQFFSTRIVWQRNSFNDLILAVADDRADHTLFANTRTGSIYAPYDGGADLFMPTSEAVAAAREQFRNWLSERDDGL